MHGFSRIKKVVACRKRTPFRIWYLSIVISDRRSAIRVSSVRIRGYFFSS